jgi:hypothetical protein
MKLQMMRSLVTKNGKQQNPWSELASDFRLSAKLVPDPLLLRKSGSAGNQTRTSGSVARDSTRPQRRSKFNDMRNELKGAVAIENWRNRTNRITCVKQFRTDNYCCHRECRAPESVVHLWHLTTMLSPIFGRWGPALPVYCIEAMYE